MDSFLSFFSVKGKYFHHIRNYYEFISKTTQNFLNYNKACINFDMKF